MECLVVTGFTFGFFGFLWVWWRLSALSSRLSSVEAQLRIEKAHRQSDALDVARRAAAANIAAKQLEPTPTPAPEPVAAPVEAPPVTSPRDAEPVPVPPVEAPRAPEPPRVEAPSPPPRPVPPPRAPPPTPKPDVFDTTIAAIKRWFTEGNVPVKIGMLVLFAGVAALLKYAADQGWLTVPIEFRLAGIALAAIGGVIFGWRERVTRRSFGLSLQGGSIGILLMTSFAAFRLYHLIPSEAAFALMLVLVVGAGLLAVLQDSIALAVLGITAGFLSPILVSTGSGNYVALFSFYTVLNLAIFGIAWAKSWRILNLLGFAFTFVIGTTWGVLKYEPEFFSNVEPFLLGFFTIYLLVPIVTAVRRPDEKRGVVDGTLVFGNPLLTISLQAGLLRGDEMPLAYTALGFAALYVLLAAWLFRKTGTARVLGESFAVLGVGFATLSVPLALSARATACTFAFEGTALVWLGFRQDRRLPRWSGLLLQFAAAIAFSTSLAAHPPPVDAHVIANAGFISALFIAVAAFITSWLYAEKSKAAWLSVPLYLWGLTWWAGAGLRELARFVPNQHQAPATLVFFALTAALCALMWRWVRREALPWTIAAALALCATLLFAYADAHLHTWAPWPLAALVTWAVLAFASLYAIRDAPLAQLGLSHTAWLWTWVFTLGLTLSQLAHEGRLGDGWRLALTITPLVVLWALTIQRPGLIAPPLTHRFAEWRDAVTLTQVSVAAMAFLVSLFSSGNSAPVTWLPLLNPVELLQLAMMVVLLRWLSGGGAPKWLDDRRLAVLTVTSFVFISMATLRAVHHLLDVPWNDELISTKEAQTSLSVVWSILGVAGWVLGSKRGNRAVWLTGAVLMGVVLLKLLLVDRSHLGSVFGIVSFIAYGLLCTAVGYFAPAPPRAPATPSSPGDAS